MFLTLAPGVPARRRCDVDNHGGVRVESRQPILANPHDRAEPSARRGPVPPPPPSAEAVLYIASSLVKTYTAVWFILKPSGEFSNHGELHITGPTAAGPYRHPAESSMRVKIDARTSRSATCMENSFARTSIWRRAADPRRETTDSGSRREALRTSSSAAPCGLRHTWKNEIA